MYAIAGWILVGFLLAVGLLTVIGALMLIRMNRQL